MICDLRWPIYDLKRPAAEVDLVLAVIRGKSFWVEAATAHTVRGLPDPDDAPFLECALAADVPLVTGNPRHFPKSAAKGRKRDHARTIRRNL